jgi:hypothetical protein
MTTRAISKFPCQSLAGQAPPEREGAARHEERRRAFRRGGVNVVWRRGNPELMERGYSNGGVMSRVR